MTRKCRRQKVRNIKTGQSPDDDNEEKHNQDNVFNGVQSQFKLSSLDVDSEKNLLLSLQPKKQSITQGSGQFKFQ